LGWGRKKTPSLVDAGEGGGMLKRTFKLVKTRAVKRMK